MRVVLTGLLAALLLAGCAADRPGASNPKTVTQQINLSGYPPEFRKGFTEGCSVARREKAGSRPKETKDNTQYVSGWSDGYDYCKKS